MLQLLQEVCHSGTMSSMKSAALYIGKHSTLCEPSKLSIFMYRHR